MNYLPEYLQLSSYPGVSKLLTEEQRSNATLDELRYCVALLLAEIRRREPAFTLEAARLSREWFHARLDDGDEWICWYRNDRLTCIAGDDFPPEHGGEVSMITHIARMHWPQGGEWVEVGR